MIFLGIESLFVVWCDWIDVQSVLILYESKERLSDVGNERDPWVLRDIHLCYLIDTTLLIK